MKHNKWHLKMLHTFIVILLLSFSGFCTDIRTTKSASETKLIEMISRAKPLIEDVTGRKFKKRVKHRIINRSELYDMLRKCSTEYLKNNKNTDSETVAMRMESEAVISSQNIVGLYSDRTIYVIPENTESAMKTYKLSRDDFEKYVFLVVVHELVHALDEQHFHFRRMKCDMKNMEEYAAFTGESIQAILKKMTS